MTKRYLKFIEGQPLLKGVLQKENGVYEPYHRLGEAIKRRVAELIREERNPDGLSLSINDYIPFFDDDKQGVNNFQTDRLRRLMIKKSDGRWVNNETNYPNDILQAFWYCYAHYKVPGRYQKKSHISIPKLDYFSRFAGFKSFEDLIQIEFSGDEPLNILLIPFRNTRAISTKIEDNIAYLFRELADKGDLPVNVMDFPDGFSGDVVNNPSRVVRKLGEEYTAHVVIRGNRIADDLFQLDCFITNPVWAYYQGSWSERFQSQDLYDENSQIWKRLAYTIYWCLFNRHFLRDDYESCIKYLRKILVLRVDDYEAFLRTAVILDLKEYSNRARDKYLQTLARAGVRQASDQLNRLYGMRNEQDINKIIDNHGICSYDYVRKSDIEFDSQSDPLKKYMYFEIARIKLFLKTKKHLTPETFERVLRKIIRYTKIEWLPDRIKPAFGEVNFEMGTFLQKRLVAGHFIRTEQISNYFERAIRFSDEERIHIHCRDFFVSSGEIKEMAAMVADHHAGNLQLIDIYGSYL